MPTTYAIPDGRTVMAATLYTGNGSTQTINNSANGVSFAPDWVWIKKRSAAAGSGLFDTVRGAGIVLTSNITDAERNNGTGSGGDLIAFNSNGFNLGNNTTGSAADTNLSGGTYVGWQWNAGGTTVTNTSGSISAQVRANTTAGFSVVTYTGTGANATVGHGLGVAPKMFIVKRRNSADSWAVYNANLTSAAYILELQTTGAQSSVPSCFNSTAPTSTVFSIGTNTGTNASGGTYVAYCFAPVAGYSAFGSYVGTSTSDGTFVYLGFRPRWIMIKNISIGTAGQSDWVIYDTSRAPYNVDAVYLLANLANAEATSGGNEYIDILSNGFKLRGASNYTNSSSYTYIYAAFAETAFKFSNAR